MRLLAEDLRCLDAHAHLGNCIIDANPEKALRLRRLERYEDAEKVLEKMLRLNPPDNQGARFVIDKVRDKTSWHPGMR
jgi:hypothetical protein